MSGSPLCSASFHAVPFMEPDAKPYAGPKGFGPKELGRYILRQMEKAGERCVVKRCGAYAAVVEKVAVAASVVCSPSELMPKTMTTYSVDASRPSKSSRLRPVWV